MIGSIIMRELKGILFGGLPSNDLEARVVGVAETRGTSYMPKKPGKIVETQNIGTKTTYEGRKKHHDPLKEIRERLREVRETYQIGDYVNGGFRLEHNLYNIRTGVLYGKEGDIIPETRLGSFEGNLENGVLGVDKSVTIRNPRVVVREGLVQIKDIGEVGNEANGRFIVNEPVYMPGRYGPKLELSVDANRDRQKIYGMNSAGYEFILKKITQGECFRRKKKGELQKAA